MAVAGAALACSVAAATDVDDRPATVAIAAVRFVDAAPAGPNVAVRLDEIRRRIQSALVYPPLARLHGVEGEAVVHFDVGRDGRARELEVAASSGAPSLDRAALRAIAAAAPLPWVYGRLVVPVRFALGETR
jgi:protein TonB